MMYPDFGRTPMMRQHYVSRLRPLLISSWSEWCHIHQLQHFGIAPCSYWVYCPIRHLIFPELPQFKNHCNISKLKHSKTLTLWKALWVMDDSTRIATRNVANQPCVFLILFPGGRHDIVTEHQVLYTLLYMWRASQIQLCTFSYVFHQSWLEQKCSRHTSENVAIAIRSGRILRTLPQSQDVSKD